MRLVITDEWDNTETCRQKQITFQYTQTVLNKRKNKNRELYKLHCCTRRLFSFSPQVEITLETETKLYYRPSSSCSHLDFHPIQINVTKPRLEGEIVWFLSIQCILASIHGYKEHDQDGGSMIRVYRNTTYTQSLKARWFEEVMRRGKGGKRSLCLDYTTSWTKLLYWVMLRFRMSAQGPITRSKRSRSSLTHLREPRAMTVAARGRFRTRAISPDMKKGNKYNDRLSATLLMSFIMVQPSWLSQIQMNVTNPMLKGSGS